jgi:hypothetical protein
MQEKLRCPRRDSKDLTSCGGDVKDLKDEADELNKIK